MARKAARRGRMLTWTMTTCHLLFLSQKSLGKAMAVRTYTGVRSRSLETLKNCSLKRVRSQHLLLRKGILVPWKLELIDCIQIPKYQKGLGRGGLLLCRLRLGLRGLHNARSRAPKSRLKVHRGVSSSLRDHLPRNHQSSKLVQ